MPRLVRIDAQLDLAPDAVPDRPQAGRVVLSRDADREIGEVDWDGPPYRLSATPLYPPLTAATARLSIGADLKDLELYLELSSRADTIEVGGLLTTRISDKIRDIVVISTVPVPRRRAKASTHESVDAGALETP